MRWGLPRFSTRSFFVSFAFIALATVLGVLLKESTAARAEQSLCRGNLVFISAGLADYITVEGRFPPAMVRDSFGKPKHSWRVLVLPYLGYSDLYGRYRFDEPWNGPHNALLASETPQVFRCPCDKSRPNGVTSYVAIVGPTTVWPVCRTIRGTDCSKGSSRILMIIEAGELNINWLEPRDLVVEPIPGLCKVTNNGTFEGIHGSVRLGAVYGSPTELECPLSISEIAKAARRFP